MKFEGKSRKNERRPERETSSGPADARRVEGAALSQAEHADPDESAVARHYNNLAPSYSQLYERPSRMKHFYHARKSRVVELLDGVTEGRILEVGCATGEMVESLVTGNVHYHGVDISSGMIAQCQQRFSDLANAHFEIGDTRKLGFPDGSFDIALCLGMIEYVPDERAAIRELVRVLKPGGILILSGLNRRSPYNAWARMVHRRLLKGRNPGAIVNEYHVEAEYRAWLDSEGVSTVEVIYYDFDLFLPPLDRRLARWAVASSEKLEWLGRGRIRKLGNGFLVKGVKPQTSNNEFPG